ncbi:MAG: hypothetical protein LBJ46_10695 [Planctomycetota bacterium]|jgi:hypothetical protein|nr:hypothetical protein [Planctomycetota bacterium]
MSKTSVFVLILAFVVSAAPRGGAAGFLARFRGRDAAGSAMFPETGDVPTLKKTTKVLSYRGETFQKHYGRAGNRYLQYGMQNMLSAEYEYGDAGGMLTIEIATMESPTSAAGIFHYHRGAILRNAGRQVDVGAEGVIDVERDGRNLYFYKSNIFVKVIYSGREPVPDLAAVARAVDAKMGGRKEERPDGFRYIEVPGVNAATVELTPGFTFNMTFLPPAVWASAPGGGSTASDLFIIGRRSYKEAAQLYRDYSSYLRLSGENFTEFSRGRQKFTQAVDPQQGRVIFSAYKNALIIAARPDGYEKGEALIQAVMRRIDSLDGDRRR